MKKNKLHSVSDEIEEKTINGEGHRKENDSAFLCDCSMC